jgi:nucleoside-diphosphate-sugar epimerase/pimeloyl-ACP methyl ester carboxylesterase
MRTSSRDAEVLVTGGTGFIGRWLLTSLTRNGTPTAALVRNATQRSSELRRFVERLGGDPSLLVVLEGDVEQRGLALEAPLPGVRVVHHLAARFDFGLDPADARRSNVEGTQNVLEWASQLSRLERFVLLGGYRMTVRDQATLEDPRLYARHGAYEASKCEALGLARRFVRDRPMPFTAVHPSGVIGDSRTGETTQLVGMGEMVQRLFAGAIPTLAGSPRTFVPVVSVDYLADFLASVPARTESEGQDLVVFHPDSPPLGGLVKKIGAHLGVTAPDRFAPLSLVRRLPRALSGIHPESVDFLSEDRYDTASAETHARAVGLAHPNLDRALAVWCDWLVSTRFLRDPPTRGRFDGGTFVVGEPRSASHLLLHGIPFDGEAMAPLGERLVESGAASSMARIDLPGLGRSASRAGALHDGLSELFGEGRPPITLVGHSLGASVALDWAVANPGRVRALVLIAPAFLQSKPSWLFRLPTLVGWRMRCFDDASFAAHFSITDGAAHRPVSSAVSQLHRKRVACRNGLALARAADPSRRARSRASLELLLSQKVPVLVLDGERDPVVHPTGSAERHTVRGGGHNIHLTHTGEVAAAVSAFEASLGPAPQRGGEVAAANISATRRVSQNASPS